MFVRRFLALSAVVVTASSAVLIGGAAQAARSETTPQRSAQGRPSLAEVAERSGFSAELMTGPFHIINQNSNKCLTINENRRDNNTRAVQRACDDVSPFTEEWYQVSAGLHINAVHLVNADTGKCLTMQGASTANNAMAVQYDCDSSPPFNENWVIDGNHIVNWHSNKCLTVYYASTAENITAVQFTCENSAPFNENWRFVRV